MSGIAGIINFDGAPAEPGLIEKMTAAMSHRGPDGIHHWVQGSVALGQCMLRTTPESLEEKQPLANDDETLVLVMDGRVDNWEELRQGLLGRGARLRDRSDAELVLRSYEVWGEDCLQHIDGDFAFVIWDARQRKAFCARDVFGTRPIYYRADSHTAAFASELHALFQDGRLHKSPNEGMVAEHLVAAITSRSDTLFEGIQRLPPAHSLWLRPAVDRARAYWTFKPGRVVRHSTETEYIEHFRTLLEDSVRRRLRRVGPVASYLSGGLDSSTVSVTAASILAREGTSDGLRTFSLVFPGERHDESEFVSETAAFSGLKPALLPPVKQGPEFYRQQVARYQSPPSTPNGEPMLGPARLAARESGCRVLLTGLGGNECLEGSWLHLADLLSAGRWARLLSTARADAELWSGEEGVPWRALLHYGLWPLVPAPLRNLARRRRRPCYPWLMEDFARRSQVVERTRPPASKRQYPTYAQQGIADFALSGWHAHCLEENDREAAAHGIEERHPFYDRQLVEFLFAVPDDLRCRGTQVKYILRQAMSGALPGRLLSRLHQAEFSGLLWSAMDTVNVEGMFAHSRLRDLNWVDAGVLQDDYRNRHNQGGRGPWVFWFFAGMEYWASGVLPGPSTDPAREPEPQTAC